MARPSGCCQCHTISSERTQHGDSLALACSRGQVINASIARQSMACSGAHAEVSQGTAAVGRCAMSRNGIKLWHTYHTKTDRSIRAKHTLDQKKGGATRALNERNQAKNRMRFSNSRRNFSATISNCFDGSASAFVEGFSCLIIGFYTGSSSRFRDFPGRLPVVIRFQIFQMPLS
jgi:hypothetical protein